MLNNDFPYSHNISFFFFDIFVFPPSPVFDRAPFIEQSSCSYLFVTNAVELNSHSLTGSAEEARGPDVWPECLRQQHPVPEGTGPVLQGKTQSFVTLKPQLCTCVQLHWKGFLMHNTQKHLITCLFGNSQIVRLSSVKAESSSQWLKMFV